MTDLSSEQTTALNKLDYQIVLHLIQEQTVSDAAREYLANWRPFSELEQVLIIQERITALRTLIDSQAEIPLRNFADLRPELARCRISGTYLTPSDFGAMRQLLNIIAQLLRFFRSHQETLKPLHELQKGFQPLPHIIKLINAFLDDNEQIRDNASPELRRIRQAKRNCQQRLQQLITRLTEQTQRAGWLHEEQPTIRDGRFVLPLRVEHKRKVVGILHGQSATGATVYIEPLEIVEVNNELVELDQAEQAAIETILRQATDAVRPVFEALSTNIELLIEIDSLNAAARFSRRFDCYPPHVTPDEYIFNLSKARHPILALHKAVVPLDFTTPPGKRIVLLSGPNAGGKTVAMKTVGLLTLMAMSGWHIPAAADSQIPFFERFLVDIGDQQSLENDLSTFSSHITNLQHFLELANSRSLVLIDELGTGTEPGEGAALSQAILIELAESGAWTIATTHHHALKEFAERHPAALNAAMEFDRQSLAPTYRIQLGLPGSSYAFEIASRLGLKPEVIKRARQLLGVEGAEFNLLLDRIAALKSELEKKYHEQERAKATLDRLIGEYEAKLQHIREKEAQKATEIINQLEELLEKSRQRLEISIKEIREKAADKATISAARQTLDQIEKESAQLKARFAPIRKPQSPSLQVGNQVRIAGLSETGIVTTLPGKNKRCAVNVSGKTLWIPADNLQVIETTEEKTPTPQPIIVQAETTAPLQLDLRGMRVDEAESALLKFLDQALLKGLSQVEIIHGYGTGALQKLTHQILKTFPGVKNFHFEDFDSGGSGATIVEF